MSSWRCVLRASPAGFDPTIAGAGLAHRIAQGNPGPWDRCQRGVADRGDGAERGPTWPTTLPGDRSPIGRKHPRVSCRWQG